MAHLSAPITHIWIDEKGVPWIGKTGYRVQMLVAEHVAWGWSPQELSWNHYGAVTVAQAYAALAYYYDNREQVDRALSEERAEVEALRKELGEPFTREQLLARRAG